MFQWLKNIYWRIQRPVMETILNVQNDHDKYMKARMEVMQSPLWDEYYYVQHYQVDINQSGLCPLDHYLQIGWKKGYNPSTLFDTKAYGPCQGNPLADYLLRGRTHSRCVYMSNVYPYSEVAIKNYLIEKSKRKSDKVVYTCITNDYDDIKAIRGYHYIDPEWDYVCFSDNAQLIEEKQVGIWEIRPLFFNQLDNTRNNRYHKLFPHLLFPDYNQSIYIDANINILTPYLFTEIEQRQTDILLPIMLYFCCIYQTESWLIDNGANADIVHRQLEKYRQDGFPQNYGMFENNVIYRKHQEPTIIQMMEQWWTWIRDYCQRDQTSLAYIFWKNNYSIAEHAIHNIWFDYKNFCIYPHLKKRVFNS